MGSGRRTFVGDLALLFGDVKVVVLGYNVMETDAFIFVLKDAHTGIHSMACIAHLRMTKLRLSNMIRDLSLFGPIRCKSAIADLSILCLC